MCHNTFLISTELLSWSSASFGYLLQNWRKLSMWNVCQKILLMWVQPVIMFFFVQLSVTFCINTRYLLNMLYKTNLFTVFSFKENSYTKCIRVCVTINWPLYFRQWIMKTFLLYIQANTALLLRGHFQYVKYKKHKYGNSLTLDVIKWSSSGCCLNATSWQHNILQRSEAFWPSVITSFFVVCLLISLLYGVQRRGIHFFQYRSFSA